MKQFKNIKLVFFILLILILSSFSILAQDYGSGIYGSEFYGGSANQTQQNITQIQQNITQIQQNITQINITEQTIIQDTLEEGCKESWDCIEWSQCSDGKQIRSCRDLNNCETTLNKPLESRECVVQVPGPIVIEKKVEVPAKTNWLLWIILIIALIAFAFVLTYLIFRIRRVKSEYLKKKEEVEQKEEPKPQEEKPEEEKVQVTKPEETDKIQDKNKKDIMQEHDQEHIDNLENYIKQSLAKGFNKEKIKVELTLAGWPKDLVENLLNKYK